MTENLPSPSGQAPIVPVEGSPPQPFENPFRLRDPEEDEGSFSLKSLLPTIKRFWWVFALSVVLGSAAAYYAHGMGVPVYEAEGELWISTEPRGQSGTAAGPITQGGLLQGTTWIDLLTSMAVLETVVVDQRMYLNYPAADSAIFRHFGLNRVYAPGSYRLLVPLVGGTYSIQSADGIEMENGPIGPTLGASLGFDWQVEPLELVPGTDLPFSVVTPREAAQSLARRITPSLDRQANFLSLQLRGRNPVRIAGVLNAVMERHVEVAAELKRVKLEEQTEVLRGQLATAEEDLRSAEQALSSYQVRTITQPSEETSPVVSGLQQTTSTVYSEYFGLRLDEETLRRDRIRLETALDQTITTGSVPVEAFEMIPVVLQSSELSSALSQLSLERSTYRQLSEDYTDEYGPVADVLARIQTLEEMTIPNLARGLLAELMAQEASMGELIQSREADLTAIPPRAMEEARRQRDFQIANDLYVDLQRRYSTAQLAAASSIPDVRILDEASVPRSPATDPRVQYAAIAFFSFLGLGFMIVLLAHKLDPKLRDPAQIGDQIGLEWLGTIPQFRKTGRKKDNAEEIREAFRDLRMKVDYAFGASKPLLLSITSPSEGEGKTFVSANLANAFADLGRKTVLVDGDTRRGDLHHILGRERRPGLTDVLMNGRSYNVIQDTDNPSLFFVGFGSRSPNSPELLNSANMQPFLASLKRRFDVILFDCPPMAAGSDAFVIGAHTGAVLTVLRSGATNKELAAAKMESFLRLPVRILGAVLNGFTPQIGQGYYKYYSNYLPGYEAGEEMELEEAPAQIVETSEASD